METVFITGAGRGIGLELTRQFLQAGYQVISTYREKPSDALAALESKAALRLLELEVTDQTSIEKVASTLSDQTIDILINNAGVLGPDEQGLQTLKSQAWMDTIAINSIAPFMVSSALLDQIKRASNPRIITISSQMGSLNSTATGMYAYRSSKAAVNKVMRVMASELEADGVIVCPIHPGWVRTDMGGDSADVSVQDSARGILNFIEKLTMDSSGRFFTWESQELQW